MNPGTVMGPILPPVLNASMAMILHLLQGNFLGYHEILGTSFKFVEINSFRSAGLQVIGCLLILLCNVGCTEIYEDFFMGVVHVKDVALAHIMLYENPSSTGRHLCIETICHYGDFHAKVAEMYPEYNLPR